MGKLVILELEGDFQQAGFRATLEICPEETLPGLKIKGSLPPDPELAIHLQHHWQEHYRSLGVAPTRIKGQKIIHKGSINRRLADCRASAQQVCDRLHIWLHAASFQTLDRRLREELHRDEAIRFLIRTTDPQVQKLPWHEWDFFERYTQAEIALSPLEYEPITPVATLDRPARVRILAILGNSQGIDIETDRRKLEALPNADIEFLVEPDRQQVSDRLWERSWDILFFAGHSETQQNSGRIYINQTDSLSISELKYGLRQAIAHGLQLAIFNSCDGLGLARELQSLNLPQMIVMREPVIDQVAHRFLHYFLDAYSRGTPLYQATRQARERLQGLEDQFPCASWLPIICQNAIANPPTWQTLCGSSPSLFPVVQPALQALEQFPEQGEYAERRTVAPLHSILKPLVRVVGLSTLITLAVLGIRWVGWLELLEWKTYDQMLQLRPAEGQDKRLLVVTVTKQDIEQLGNEYPLSDRTLLTALQALQAHHPRGIGLDIYRNRPTGDGWVELTQYLQRNEGIIPICVHSSRTDPTRGVAPPPDLPALSLGFADALPDADGVVRRHLLALDPPNQSPCSASYALSTKLALRYLEAQGISLEFPTAEQWQLGTTRFPILTAPDGFYQRADQTRGHQILLNYRLYNSLGDIAQEVTLTEVLMNRVDPDLIHDKIVLIGVTDPVVDDYATTPDGSAMRGLLFHVQMASQLISAVEDQRPLLRFWPFWAEVGWVWSWAVAGGLIILWVPRFQHPWLLRGGLILVLGGISVLFMIKGGVIVPLIPSLIACLIVSSVSSELVRMQRSVQHPPPPR